MGRHSTHSTGNMRVKHVLQIEEADSLATAFVARRN